MNELSKKEMKLSLLSPNNFKEERNKIFLEKTSKSTQQNSIKILNSNTSNEEDSTPSFLNSKKKFIKNQRISNINRNVNIKNTFQYINYFWKLNQDNNSSGEIESLNNLINIQKFNNELDNNYIQYPKQKKNQKTEIIVKKVRYHDFIHSKKYINRNQLKEKVRHKENKKENSEFNYYIPVQGVYFQKNINNNFIARNIRKNLFIVENPNTTKNITPKTSHKINANGNEIKIKSSLPIIHKRDYKNRTQNMFFNKNTLNKKNYFSKDEINIKTKLKKDISLHNIHGYKKLNNLNMISIPGSDHGKTKKNQDNYFIIPKLNNCEEIKVFGIFDGHGDNGDILSQEIKEYFKNYFINLFNGKSIFEDEEFLKNNFTIKSINTKKDFFCNYNSAKFHDKKINFNSSEEIKLQNLSNKLKEKSDKIKYIYNKLTSNEYSEIFFSYKKLDEQLHSKYSNSDFCHLSGSTSLILFLFNSKNFNKIISSNLGDSKIILISEKNIIKELNTLHTLNNAEEKNRVIKNGAVINRLNVGPLRIWFKNKKYPGLSITRSFGDFESDSLGVISIPDIKEYDLDKEQIKILIFGTDGVFKFLTNDKIMNIVLPYYEQDDSEGATQKIKEIANKLWNIKNPKGIADITVFVLFFR